jgi:hypothetical protein
MIPKIKVMCNKETMPILKVYVRENSFFKAGDLNFWLHEEFKKLNMYSIKNWYGF